MPKRRRIEDANDADQDETPRKTRSLRSATKDDASEAPTPSATPSGRKSILRGTPSKLNGFSDAEPTPKSVKRVLFSTPAKDASPAQDSSAAKNDRSAQRKSKRTLQIQNGTGQDSDDELNATDEPLAREILGDEEDNEEEEELDDEAVAQADTPSKAARPRGRPKGRRRERTPSPPPDLPPHELYFFQNRPGGTKTSANTLPSHILLGHGDYFTQTKAYTDPHEQHIDQLKRLHKRAFDQWQFELDQGFNLCLYGYGSKRNLIMAFAQHIYKQAETTSKILVVNGYTPGLTIRDIFANLSKLLDTPKLPAQPSAALDIILATLSDWSGDDSIHLIIHSLDHLHLRKGITQSLIARLAAHPKISLIASCDNPNFPLLWDITLLQQFRFLFHDSTTFEPYRAEVDVVEEVNLLLGRSRRRLGGKDGVGYVLKSLPENARNLFRILVAEQLALGDIDSVGTIGNDDDDDEDDILGVDNDEEAAMQQDTPSRRGRGRKAKPTKAPKPPKVIHTAPAGVEYRTLYHKAVEEFVCSSELNFRTLLKEFHDHQMIESRKDATGTERLIVPFKRDELETMLEELA